MSWQGYVDQQLVGTGMVNKACIIGLNGGVWAQSAGFAVLVLHLSFLSSQTLARPLQLAAHLVLSSQPTRQTR